MNLRPNTGLLIEVAGPAGSGKSTLVDLIVSRSPIRPGFEPCDIGCVPLALRRSRLIPASHVWTELRSGRLPREPLRSMVYVESWLNHGTTDADPTREPRLYDHGPFFRLATISEFGPPAGEAFQRWWMAMRDAWSETMTLVVWLDAQDATLLERIRARSRGHPVETLNDSDALTWLQRYRRAFDRALEPFHRARPDDLVRYDTTDLAPSALAASLRALIEARGG